MNVGEKFSYPERYEILAHEIPIAAAVAWMEAVCPSVTINGYSPKELGENFTSRWTNKVGVVVEGEDSPYGYKDVGLYNYDGRIVLYQLSHFGDCE
jgi:hypothetical protein